MVCAVCGHEGARIRRVTRSYGKGAALLVIENVPVISCLHCGTSYLTAQTLHEIDRIKRHRHELATQRPVRLRRLPNRLQGGSSFGERAVRDYVPATS